LQTPLTEYSYRMEAVCTYRNILYFEMFVKNNKVTGVNNVFLENNW